MIASPIPSRAAVEDAIESLIALLDRLDGDADLELDTDAEPDSDAEPDVDAEPDDDAEPALGGLSQIDQRRWSWGWGGDRDPAPRQRRRQRAALPLVGGRFKVLGEPTGPAAPVTVALLESYKNWLDMERRFLLSEMAALEPFSTLYRGGGLDQLALSQEIGAWTHYDTDAARFDHHSFGHTPSTRAATVLSAVGCSWRSRQPAIGEMIVSSVDHRGFLTCGD